ncbi:MAG: hypothetical protein JKY53_08285 [Flavobacteriales bacterium]|nr:hypothetical protein [Flavobacteriales bacterium]
MAKIIVIDGLARSGTTLLNAICNSQENCAAYRGVFHEPLACNYAKWAEGYAQHDIIPDDSKVFFNHNLYRINSFFSNKKSYYFSQEMFVKKSLLTLKSRNQFQHFDQNEWEKRFDNLNFNSFSKVDDFYQRLAENVGVDNLFIRWNQGYSYINKWLRNKDHYWISVVRHPIGRAYSYFRSHEVSYENSLGNSKGFASVHDIILSKENSKFQAILYEDLITKGKEELTKMFAKFDIELPAIELLKIINNDGNPYRIESSTLVDKGEDRLKGHEYTGLDKRKLYAFRNEVSDVIQEQYRKELSGFKIYQNYY